MVKQLTFIESDSSETHEKDFVINKNYAERYDNWRGKEELQKLKDKYGSCENYDEDGNDLDSSDKDSEDDDAKELTEDMEKEFFKALSMVKSRNSSIYDKDSCVFFENSTKNQLTPKTKDKKSSKPFFMKDLEREMILNKINVENNGNIFEDDNSAKQMSVAKNKSYFEEQDEIKKKFKEAIESDSDHEVADNLLNIKQKTQKQKEKEEIEYKEWLKGNKKEVKDEDIQNNMKYLHDYWNDPKLTEGEKFLKDYILNKKYLFKNNESDQNQFESTIDTSKKSPVDQIEFSEEEDIIEHQEDFERKFNFRYEEPDAEFIKSYPRTVADSMRRADTNRKEKRDDYNERKQKEKQRKKEEIKRLKNLKKKEIMDKIKKVKSIVGKNNIAFDIDDLEKEFDPEEYEKKMQSIFNDDFYQQAENKESYDNDDDEKPVFSDDEEIENWDEWIVSNKTTTEDQVKKSKPSENKQEFHAKLNEMLLKEKPLYDPSVKTFEEYIDEYYKLDCEDVIAGELPCRFKYREVIPNDYGLEVEEIFGSKDSELNQWASLKRAIQYKPIQDEINDARIFKEKKQNSDLKKKILVSCYNEENEADSNKEQVTDNKESSSDKAAKTKVSKKHKTKKSSKNKNVLESLTDQRLSAYGIDPKKFRKKVKYEGTNSNKTEKK